MSQTCVWLSNSKYEQNTTDISATVEIRDEVAAAGRRSWSWILSAVAAAVFGVLLGHRGHVKWLCAAVALSGAMMAQGGCECAQQHEITMTVTYDGVVVEKRMTCDMLDGRAFCSSDEFKHRDQSCRTLEDVEHKEYCQEPYLNRVGRRHLCFLNPEDPSDLEISGTKSIGAGTIVAVTLWGVFTFALIVLCIVAACHKRCRRGGGGGDSGTCFFDFSFLGFCI